MILIIIGLCCLIISIILFILSSKKHHINDEVDQRNHQLEILLDNKYEELDNITDRVESIEKIRKEKSQEVDDLIKKYENIVSSQKEMADEALKSYCDNLEYQYKREKEDYDIKIKELSANYDEQKINFETNIQITKDELDKMKSTLRAIQEAELRKKEVEDNTAFYTVTIDEEDLADITVLNSIKNKLRKPRILSMLIWQTYWQKPFKALIFNVLGESNKCGVYKITNIITNECYIGQAVNISKRWTEHAKAGLGIDTPAGNKLYKAMQEFSLDNFTWELLEECPKEHLNEKEKYYIDLYDSCNIGYNSNKGVDK